jgi:hypothetical protein
MMKHALFDLRGDDAGIEVVEWVVMGALMITLIAGVYGVMNHNGSLRDALTTLNAEYAANFGRDVVAQSPGMPDSGGSTRQQDGLLIIEDGAIRAIVDPVTGSYTVINTTTGARTVVQPGSDILVAVDMERGVVSLSRERPPQTIVLSPLRQHATMIDHGTGSLNSMSLTGLQHIGVVQVWRSAPTGAAALAQAMLGVPTLLAPRP